MSMISQREEILACDLQSCWLVLQDVASGSGLFQLLPKARKVSRFFFLTVDEFREIQWQETFTADYAGTSCRPWLSASP